MLKAFSDLPNPNAKNLKAFGDITTTPPNQPKSIGGFIGNLGSSFATTIGGVVGGLADVAAHPIETFKGLGRMGAGAIQSIPPVKSFYDKNVSPKGKEELDKNIASFEAVKNYVGDRYGSWDNLKETLYKDPTGAALDIATVIDIMAGAGKLATKVPGLSKLAKPAEIAGKTAEIVNPITTATKATGAGMGYGLRKIEQPFAKSYNPELAQKFTEVGITKPPLSAVSKSQVVKGGEAIAAKSLFGGNIYDDIGKTNEALAIQTEELVNKIKPERLVQEDIGRNIKQGIEKYEENFKLTQNKVYEEFNQQLEGTAFVKMEGTGEFNIPAADELGVIDEMLSNHPGRQLMKYTSYKSSGELPEITGRAKSIFGTRGDDIISEMGLTEEMAQQAVYDYKNLVDKKRDLESLAKAERLSDGGIAAEVSKTKEILGEIIKTQNQDIYGYKNPRFQSMLKTIESGRQLSFNEMKITRSSVGEDLARTGDPMLKRLYGALSEDLNATVVRYSPSLGKKFEKINQNYKSGITKIESNLVQSIIKSNPENIAKNLLNKNSAGTLKTLKGMIGEDKFGEISNAFLTNTIEKSYTRGVFDVTKFEKNLSQYDRPVLEQLLNKKQLDILDVAVKELKTNQELINAMKSGAKIREGSQTAFLTQRMGELGAGAAFFTALFTGNYLLAAKIIAGLGAEYGLTKLFTTGIGRKYLTEGLNIGGPVKAYIQGKAPSIGRAAEAVNVIGAPQYQQPNSK